MNDDFLLSQALSAIALEGKPVEVDQATADYMGLWVDDLGSN